MRIIYTLFCGLLLSACAQINITSSWYDSTYTKIPIKSAYVVAMSDNPSTRRIFEDDMVSRLRTAGVNAVPSSQMFPNKPPTKEQIAAYAKKYNMQTVFVAQLIDVENKIVEYPEETFGYTNDLMFDGFYDNAYDYVYGGSYAVSYEEMNVAFTLFDTTSKRAIWSTSTQFDQSDDVNSTSSEVTKLLIHNMKKYDIVN